MAGKPERLQTEAANIFAGPISRIDGFPGKAQLWGRTAVALWPISTASNNFRPFPQKK